MVDFSIGSGKAKSPTKQIELSMMPNTPRSEDKSKSNN